MVVGPDCPPPQMHFFLPGSVGNRVYVYIEAVSRYVSRLEWKNGFMGFQKSTACPFSLHYQLKNMNKR